MVLGRKVVGCYFRSFLSFLLSVLLFLFGHKVVVCSPAWADTRCIAQIGLKFTPTFLAQISKCQDYRHRTSTQLLKPFVMLFLFTFLNLQPI